MFLIAAISACENPDILKIIMLIKTILNVVFIIIPIGLIVMLSIDLSKSVLSNDDSLKKPLSAIIKRLFAVVVLFLVPTLTNAMVKFIDNVLSGSSLSENVTSCLVNANTTDIASYQIEYDKFLCTERNGTWNSTNNTCGVNTSNPSPNDDDDDDTTNPSSATATIFVGDSRTVGMCSAVSLKASEKCVAKTSQGLTWLKNTAQTEVNTILNGNPNTVYNIVIYLGVNDLYNKSSYVTTFNNLATTWSKHNVVIVSVTPVDEAKEQTYGYSVKNSDITSFNSTVKNGINSSIDYCDIYGSLTFSTSDGVHYTNSTYQAIYSKINECL